MGKRFLFFICLALTAALGFIGGRRSVTTSPVEKSDTVIIRDTFIDYKPAPVTSTPLRIETCRLLLASRFADDTIPVADTVHIKDTVEVEVPLIFQRYTGDNYDIGVSGFRTELEYVKVYSETRVITKGYAIEPKRWGFGISIGPSILVTPSGNFNAGLGITGGFYLRL